MYAIVDIETTGGHASQHNIIEICIILYDGKKVENQFHTLINPQRHIPHFITALTGITDDMLEDAPLFENIATTIFSLLKGRVFVAHNVNFDYSFLYHHLLQSGYQLQTRKLCTVRYARKVKPGIPSYSLGKLCRHLNIQLENRHRAFGDALATTKLLELLLQSDTESKHLQQMIKGRNADQYLPLHVPKDQLDNLPHTPGVYYFINKYDKIVYVGKATNLNNRVRSHFSNNLSGRRKQEMLREIYSIKYTSCATELMALVLESIEIKKLWPAFNRSQKGYETIYGLYALEDQNGLLRLAVEKKCKHLPSIYAFYRQEEGFSLARKAAANAAIPEEHVFVFSAPPLLNATEKIFHNIKMKKAIELIEQSVPTFGVLQEGKDENNRPLLVGYLIEKGKFTGMGLLEPSIDIKDYNCFRAAMTSYPDHDTTRGFITNYAIRYPQSVLKW